MVYILGFGKKEHEFETWHKQIKHTNTFYYYYYYYIF